jgi:hypothetical protein
MCIGKYSDGQTFLQRIIERRQGIKPAILEEARIDLSDEVLYLGTPAPRQ